MSSKTPEQISYNMRRVKCKDSVIEVALRKELWRRGLRYRKNDKSVLGKPDIVFKGKRIAVFCDSEFWHGYDWDSRKSEIKSHQDFWFRKIEQNIKRDTEVTAGLKAKGWTVLRFWGKDIKKNAATCVDVIENAVKGKMDECRTE